MKLTDPDRGPTSLVEDLSRINVSFYDVKPHNQYNFLAGTLIEDLQRKRGEKIGEPVNLGHIKTKLADGSFLEGKATRRKININIHKKTTTE